MLSDGEPKYKRPRRLCIAISPDMVKPIYAGGFGERKHEDFTFLNEDSDGSLADNGFEVTFSHRDCFGGLGIGMRCTQRSWKWRKSVLVVMRKPCFTIEKTKNICSV